MSHTAALFRQVWANPSDDHVRRVLADALISEGDPRGELILLQYNPQRGHESRKMQLLQRYGLTWLGALRGAVVPVAYERGFIASCVVYDGASALGCEEWSTVHTVELDCADVTFVVHPVMRSLRRIVALEAPLLRWLLDHAAELPRTLEELALAIDWTDLPILWRQLESIPTLRVIELSEPDVLTVSSGPGSRLSIIDVAYQPQLIALLAALPSAALTEITVRRVPVSERAALDAALLLQRRLQTSSITEYAPRPSALHDDDDDDDNVE